jgi:hypothetical protein
MKTLSSMADQSFSDIYTKRPVWALVSSGGVGINPIFSTYGEDNPFVPISVEGQGSSRSRARPFVDEQTATYVFTGATTSPAFTGTASPNSGLNGCNASTQTACLNNFEVPDSGNAGAYSAVGSGADILATYCGTIVGESNWRQIYDLAMVGTTGAIYKDPIGGGSSTVMSQTRDRITMATEMGTEFAPVAGMNYLQGGICHNRNTGRLMIPQANGGTSGVSLGFRLHFFDLQNKISADTTIPQLRGWMNDATKAGSGRYRYVDVTLQDSSVQYVDGLTLDSLFSKFVLCDNDDVWMYKSADISATASASYGNCLFSIIKGAGTWKTATYTALAVMKWTGGTRQYGGSTGLAYAPRHMNSDDNSVIAMYQAGYYYVSGQNMAMVSTKNAVIDNFSAYAPGAVAITHSVAPAGGPSFMVCINSANNDAAGPSLLYFKNDLMKGVAVTPNTQSYLYPSVSSSTWYGGNMVCKVQPTTEWK